MQRQQMEVEILPLLGMTIAGQVLLKKSDKTLIAIVNLAKAEVITDIARTQRADTAQTATVPADWSGDTVETYLGFMSEDGKEVANSIYLGSITIA